MFASIEGMTPESQQTTNKGTNAMSSYQNLSSIPHNEDMEIFLRLPGLETVSILVTTLRVKAYHIRPARGNGHTRCLLIHNVPTKIRYRGAVLHDLMKKLIEKYPQGEQV